MTMIVSKEKAIEFIEQGILRTKNATNFEELEKQSANVRGYVFGLYICGFIAVDNLEDKYNNEYWEEQNRIAYKMGLDNVFKYINSKNK